MSIPQGSMITRMLAACVLLLLSAGCRERPAGGYIELSGRIFVFNYRVATATYVVTFAKLQPIPEGASLVTVFDNPAGGPAIQVRQRVWPRLEKVAVESPPVFCIVKNKPYNFTATLFAPDGGKMQEISGTVTSSLDQTVLPDLPLVVGPFYTPNPDLKGKPGGKLKSHEVIKC
jgi:hypothetical protein